ncbi:MAG TPA: cyclic peptide export ABC transporter [Bacillota bacterium]|nr:cyclic peptide export ABC transporter [Bacillota bacterium]
MKIFKKTIFIVLLVLFCNACLIGARADVGQLAPDQLSGSPIKVIEQFIKQQMKKKKIPGLAIVVVKGNRVFYQKGFGYADLRTKQPVTPDTLFELSSNSKAFTALGILRLIEQGLLDLTDPAQKYLPWFFMKYHGKKASISIEQLLHQTSGIPFNSIQDIPASEANSALEETVKTLVGKELVHQPGEKFLYATMNYDVLGLIIQRISGQPFEQYMQSNVLQPLGLDNTFLFRQEAVRQGLMAKGYKTGFMQALEYDAPRYRGNTPAGYFISNLKDIGEWLKIQLGTSGNADFNRLLIQESQIPDYSVGPGADDSFYSMGWFVNQVKGKTISHGGANPNYSSYIILRPAQKIGVAVLTNLGNIESGSTQFICQGVMDLANGDKPPAAPSNTNQSIDSIATIVIYVSMAIILFTLALIIIFLVELFKKERRFQGNSFKGFTFLILIFGILALTGYALYMIPDVMMQGFHWDFVSVWGPVSVPVASILAFAAIIIFFLHYVLITFFPKPEEKPFFNLIVLSIASGMGNAFIIFTINAAFGSNRNQFATTLFLYFILAIIIYVFGTRMVRKRMITITNDIVYFKRITLINKILKASYQKLEALEGGKIHAGLNNDTEVVSNLANLLIDGVTSLITLICCFVYLGILNIYGLLISILVIGVAAGMYFYIGKSARKLWERMRDTQNQFFQFIHDLVSGFKELTLHPQKQEEFAADMQQTCKTYRDKRLAGEFKFINVFVIGELMFTVVIAVVAFVFPLVFNEMNTNDLRAYIFIFLYMTGPVHGMLNTIPRIIQFQISWKRINQLLEEINVIEVVEPGFSKPEVWDLEPKNSLQLDGVVFQYQNEKGEEFTIGPIDAEFGTGELTMLTGGNGSGKSTLAKLITGLYIPLQGEIKINGATASPHSLKQLYSAIFSDFYLFKKLYGIEYRSQQTTAEHYLKILKLDEKVQIKDGVFSTIKLSTGQKKRLALLACYLEDRPIYLFDEWAAEQDSEFRKFFYQELLPGLRKRGKCVIVISHDDRYFGIADKVIKMEMGKIVETTKVVPAQNPGIA